MNCTIRKCPNQLATNGRCKTHLKQLSEEVRKRNYERKASGVCIQCDNPIHNGTLRCLKHTMENRERASKWYGQHPEARAREMVKYYTLKKMGICRCSAKNPLKNGYASCDDCRFNDRNYPYQRIQIKMEKAFG